MDLKTLKIKDNGIMDWAIEFVNKTQLKNRELWLKFAEVFKTREDSTLGRWRGEYFGKQMRGAVLTYLYNKDEELFDILTQTVKALLQNQDELGRFSTYEVHEEFRGWDMWCRKYVLVGMLYYLEICKDAELKSEIISACKKHLDYILTKIGDKEGQTPILATSHWWGTVNSCTILEPTVEMYKLTGEKRYLDFAEYIISVGGCSDCNLIELALKDEIAPYEYPVTKAYEMMSFYEGLVAYYEVTGKEVYLEAVIKFVEAVNRTDITIIGCSGCTHELFDNSAKMQTEPHENIMQETCVTVTWIRLLRRLYLINKNNKYIDRIEKSGFNALYGSLNVELNKQLKMEDGTFVEGMAFDSYSPLYMNTRGRGIGGYNDFASGSYYGCCLAIGACGVALMPFTAVMQMDDGIYINYPVQGSVEITDAQGKPATLTFECNSSIENSYKITVHCDGNCDLLLKLREPEWSAEMRVNGEAVKSDGYLSYFGKFNDGDEILVEHSIELSEICLNGKIAFTYGAITLATDEFKAGYDFTKPLPKGGITSINFLDREDGELIRVECELSNGKKIILTDYQSCGKKWSSDKPLMTVWFDLEQ